MRRALALIALVLLGGCADWRSRWPGPDVVYAPTPEGVAVEMLRLAGTGAGDVVYDLGSGDGRVVIAAAREFGALAVGVEIDPGLVQESREAALAAGVAERVRILWQDLFATPLVDATVVTLYLRDDVNLRLRPKLLRELRPGARIVSHDFGMGDWVPDVTRRVRGPLRDHRLHLWIVPADAAGAWVGQLGTTPLGLTLEQTLQRVEGTARIADRATALRDGRLRGADISFQAAGWRFAGRVAGDAIAGRASNGSTDVEWSVRRQR
ncbi:MAG TPA: class I SAM-dependent methyltransferase [Candidatus Tectomicrobia bacterium]|nr:class I SAM-dependent methyltransferase [Candidatus Tectomicrobia bacterium]